MKLFSAVFLVLLTCGLSHAQAFDCLHPAMPSDHVICGDTDLIQKNEDMAALWSSLYPSLDGAGKAALVQEQKDWLGKLNRQCELPDKGKPPEKTLSHALRCVSQSLNQRIAALKQRSQSLVETSPDAPRPLTKEEEKQFAPLLCKSPRPYSDPEIGKDLIACRGRPYPRETALSDAIDWIGLTSIHYGSFSKVGANETYLSYRSSDEPHSSNFGGGALFEKTAAGWKLLRVISGQQTNDCLPIPSDTVKKLLCLNQFEAQGHVIRDVSLWQLTPGEAEESRLPTLLAGEDSRDAYPPDDSDNLDCKDAETKSKPAVIAVLDLYRPANSTDLAVSHVVYAERKDILAACRAKAFSRMKTQIGLVRYVLEGGEIKLVSPIAFE